MNIEAENLDTLRELVRKLQIENKKLKEKLIKASIPFSEENLFEEKIDDSQEYDLDQGGRINKVFITDDLANYFFYMFWGRTDVYAKRGKNGGYFPQCDNRWNDSLCPKQRGEKIICDECKNVKWSKLSVKTIVNHLIGYKEDGSDVIGVYPLLSNGTCKFIVFDFDNHEKGSSVNDYANDDEEWRKEVDALRIICDKNNIKCLVERSRSGKGAHLWIFFKDSISASLARKFGFMLLDMGQSLVNMKTFKYYDRMYPCQDASNSLGNLIALPLQGQALKNGNSAFVDENWNAYPNQWDVLFNQTSKLSLEDINNYIQKWEVELYEHNGIITKEASTRPKPWKKKQEFNKNDVVGKLHIVLGDGVYVDVLNLMPRIQNQIRSLAAFDNPIFYKNKRLGYSNYYNLSSIYMGKDVDGYVCLPRGLKEELIKKCNETKIEYDVDDQREKGRPIRVLFKGKLDDDQQDAANALLEHDYGILSATTSFGKTVISAYLIGERKVNTLILLQRKDLLDQWINELNKFLIIDEQPPTYKTKSGREKKRDSVIGCLTGNKNSLTGIIDVAMIGSIYSKGNFNEFFNSYGMVIMDECHHCGSDTSIKVMQKVNARYVYGVSATIKRSDNLERIIHMLLGPIRLTYSAKQRAEKTGIKHYVYPRFTRVTSFESFDNDINGAYSLVCNNKIRNDMIIEDVKNAVKNNRTPVILTRYKEHAKTLYENLLNSADCVYLIYGDNTDKENRNIIRKLNEVPKDKSLILVATGQKVGEGFNLPRLDTLMLAAPVSTQSSLLQQYVGRIDRIYEGKEDVLVYDYVDSHIKQFNNMYAKRLKAYKKLAYSVVSNTVLEKQTANAIYDSGNYIDIFERDLVEAEKRIVISSPYISQDRIDRFLYITKSRTDNGCKITVVTTNPEQSLFSNEVACYEMIKQMIDAGIQVVTKENVDECFAIIDEDLVWHGGVNLLGKEDAWDNLMRIKSYAVAEELQEISLGFKKEKSCK